MYLHVSWRRDIYVEVDMSLVAVGIGVHNNAFKNPYALIYEFYSEQLHLW